MNLVAGSVQAATLAPVCRRAHQLNSLAVPVQGHTESMPETGRRHNGIAPWVETGDSCWAIFKPPSPDWVGLIRAALGHMKCSCSFCWGRSTQPLSAVPSGWGFPRGKGKISPCLTMDHCCCIMWTGRSPAAPACLFHAGLDSGYIQWSLNMNPIFFKAQKHCKYSIIHSSYFGLFKIMFKYLCIYLNLFKYKIFIFL